MEQNIKAAREAALDAADTDSVITGTSITGGQEGTLPNFFSLFIALFIYSQTVVKLQINKSKFHFHATVITVRNVVAAR